MKSKSHLLRRPKLDLSTEALSAFEALYDYHHTLNDGAPIDYNLPYPKWQFLIYATERRKALSHGSGNPEIKEFEPRKADDAFEFGDQKAVYAASDGIWAMFFAIVDRDGSVTGLCNACITYEGDEEPYYYFSINEHPSPNRWRRGTVYLLPGETFDQQAPMTVDGKQVSIAQFRSFEPVRPFAKLAVGPEDFPFLDRIRRHNPKELRAKALADPEGFPWH